MKRIFKSAFSLLIAGVVSFSASAQVNIGSDEDPHKGAILDMSASNNLGVIFPNVFLFDTGSFQLPQDPSRQATGMVVYNTNPDLAGSVGLYIWTGSEWKGLLKNGDITDCDPVAISIEGNKTGMAYNFTVNVTAGKPRYSYVWYREGQTAPVRENNNVMSSSDTYSTPVVGNYYCMVSNPCVTTPIKSNVVAIGEADEKIYISNGNGTYTDENGFLVKIGDDDKIGTQDDEKFVPVQSDLPGIFKDLAGNLVYAGADGIPGNADDGVLAPITTPLKKQNILFSVMYPAWTIINLNTSYQIELDFANGASSYTGQVLYLSDRPDLAAVNANGLLTVGNSEAPCNLAIVLEDGSVVQGIYNIRAVSPTLGGVNNTSIDIEQGAVKCIQPSLICNDLSNTIYNLKSLAYSINPSGTGSTITQGGWFHAGTPGTATVTVTATNISNATFTGTITVNIKNVAIFPPETLPYETASTNWANLDPAPVYAGGDGSAASPYKISSVRQMKKLSVDVTNEAAEASYQKFFEMTADLDFAGDNTVTSSLIGPFCGTFDGKGHLIKNLHIITNETNTGIFATLQYGEIKNLGREGGSITSAGGVSAGLVGTLADGKLKNCYSSASISGKSASGGLVGTVTGTSIIENCYNTGSISGTMQIGGLAGSTLWGGKNVIFINSYNAGYIVGSDKVGGLLGDINHSNGGNKQDLNMTNCFNFGDVTAKSNVNTVGSVLGTISETSPAIIEVHATTVYSSQNVAKANNGGIQKNNQPLGWGNGAGESLKNTILTANPTLKEDAKYSSAYSVSQAFAIELGQSFKYAPGGRTPKLAWEK
jgi:hypothetical protein